MWYICCLIGGYIIGVLISRWMNRDSINLRLAKGIKFYYHPVTEDVVKLELFFNEDSFNEEKLKKYKIFFDRER